ADQLNEAVRKVDLASGTVTTVAGVLGQRGADDGPATSAHLSGPAVVAADGIGHVFIGDQNNALVRRDDLTTDALSTLVGTLGRPGVRLGPLPAQLGAPTALALTQKGQLLIASENALLIAR
ncbi:MAG: repeat-containing protein, partial [bacterium]|nr:repeat-containing protein [bacterium]